MEDVELTDGFTFQVIFLNKLLCQFHFFGMATLLVSNK